MQVLAFVMLIAFWVAAADAVIAGNRSPEDKVA